MVGVGAGFKPALLGFFPGDHGYRRESYMNRIVLFLLFFVGWCFCSAVSAGEGDAVVRRVLVLETTDIHAHIGTGDEEGDWLILAGMIGKARKDAGGAENTLLLDCGDTLSGTLLGEVSKGAASVEMLNALRYDAWIPGNHDFEFPRKRLLELWGAVKPAKLAANLELSGAGTAGWRMFRKNGARVAVIGMTSPYLRKWLWGSRLTGLRLKGIFETLDKVVPEVFDAKPDMTILAIHQGRFPPVRLGGTALAAIAERYPQIDLILGGHTHQLVPGERLGKSRVWYVEPGGHGVALGRIEAEIDVERHLVVDIQSRLVPVAGRKADMSVLPEESRKRLEKWIAATKRRARERVGRFAGGLKAATKRLLEGMMSVSGAEAAFGRIPGDAAALSGDVTGRDLFDAVPYDDTVCVLELGRGEVMTVIQEQLDAAKDGKGALSWRGVTLKRAADGSPRLFLANGKEWESGSDKRILVAFPSYDLGSAGGRYIKLAEIAGRPECRGRDTGTGVREAVGEGR